MRTYPEVACAVGEVLLPAPHVDPTRWAVVACDQYTSQPAWWEAAHAFVGDAPSTLRIIYPELYLNEPDKQARIAAIHAHMARYLEQGVFQTHEGLVYLERQVGSHVRKGLVLCLDLEHYDYSKGSGTLIRATEGTIVDRLPPRMVIREGAPLESPHIMVLLDDPTDSVIGPVAAATAAHRKLYDFDLMASSGHITGWGVVDAALEAGVMGALAALADKDAFHARYGLTRPTPVLLHAMGDGNHSLATAKAVWEKTKTQAHDKDAVMVSPLRYALVELVNIYDVSLEFEPIHRVLFHMQRDVLAEIQAHFGARCTVLPVADVAEMESRVRAGTSQAQRFGFIDSRGIQVVEIQDPPTALAVGTLQAFLDPFLKSGGAREIDYVHGTDVVADLGSQAGNVGFYLPSMAKSDLFRSVILDGALPRKTFSMGEAKDKRFYLECRRIG